MEVIGYIICALTFILGLCIKLIRGTDSTLIKARETIKDQFVQAYREFGSVAGVSGEKGREVTMLDTSVNRLKRLHCASIADLLLLKRIEWVLAKNTKLVLLVIIAAICSVLYGRLFVGEGRVIMRNLFLVGIPSVVFLSQGVLFLWIIDKERYMNRVIERYKGGEY